MLDASNMTDHQKKVLYDILIELSWRERNCWLAHTAYMYSFSEVAEVMKISRSSVQTYMERARKKINNMRGYIDAS
ncbi:sigma factor-like helix-turn-helix DNA-binding protein [Virgibacillus sp. YIM 98842]|uniref:sigma factor-like helix-turn-helix DNA-binding protein n=1 Tax=Virgibacillus sp. YIM 98842 TaxID=2663533 RepID=UPI0013DBF8E0|nr:sigma factor-like helix-turn-helix DNA-binding protein [Virgibacillus sp. YIM 98842]